MVDYLLAAGSRVQVPAAAAHSEWLAVAAIDRVGERLVARLVAPIAAADALRVGAALLVNEVTAEFDGAQLSGRTVRRLGAIELSVTPSAPPTPAAHQAVRAWIADHCEPAADDGGADWFSRLAAAAGEAGEAADNLRRRIAFLHRTLGAPWPALDAASLTAETDPDGSLAHIVSALAAGVKPVSLDLAGAVRGLVPWPEAGQLDALAPERLELPSGNRHRIRYPAPQAGVVEADDVPVIAAKLQEFFGLAASPRIADGRVPVGVELLSPAGRPLALSRDLEFFWNEVYPGVRAEMRGRYPKHPWPQDPWTAQATAKTNRGLRAD